MNQDIFLRIGEREIGTGKPCFLVAEIGINHNGDLELAKKTVDAAVEAGADSVKFQNYRTEDFLSDRSLTYEYVSQGKTVVESQYDMFKRYEMSSEFLRELKAYCDRKEILFHSTPMGIEGLNELVALGVPVMKNGSDCLVHLPLIRAMGKSGLPTIISTGMGTLSEIDDAARAFRETGNQHLMLLHCTSCYPTPPADVHLRKMEALSAAFDCPVGLSDHTEGWVAAVAAVTMGACWIEKHFTLDKTLPGPDHRFSADGAEFRGLVEAVRTAEKNLGSSCIQPTQSEMKSRREFQLSCVAARDLAGGQILLDQDITFRRPGAGVPPKNADLLIGRTLKRAVKVGEQIEFGDLG